MIRSSKALRVANLLGYNGKGRPVCNSSFLRQLSSQAAKGHTVRGQRQDFSHALPRPCISRAVIEQRPRRYASTIPAPSTIPTDAAVGAPVNPPSTTILPDDWAVSLDNITSEGLLPLQEHVGYLKALGLDYGWGPTALIEYLLEHVHIYSHTPWWGSIILTAFLVRASLLKLNINAADMGGRLARVTPLMKPLQAEMAAAKAAQDTTLMLTLSAKYRSMLKGEGVQMWKMFLPLIQIPLGYGTFRLLQGMSRLPVPGLDEGGLLWIKDLTVADPYMTLPALTSLMMYITFKKGGETGTASAATMTPAMKNIFTYGLPAMSFFFMMWWPACVQLTFTTTSFIALGMSMMFRNPTIRAFLGITPLPPIVVPTTTGPYKGVMNLYQPHDAAQESTKTRKNVFREAFADVKGAAKTVLGNAKDVQKGGSKPGKRLTPGELRRAKAYEEKRRKEIELERWEAESRGKARRRT